MLFNPLLEQRPPTSSSMALLSPAVFTYLDWTHSSPQGVGPFSVRGRILLSCPSHGYHSVTTLSGSILATFRFQLHCLNHTSFSTSLMAHQGNAFTLNICILKTISQRDNKLLFQALSWVICQRSRLRVHKCSLFAFLCLLEARPWGWSSETNTGSKHLLFSSWPLYPVSSWKKPSVLSTDNPWLFVFHFLLFLRLGCRS